MFQKFLLRLRNYLIIVVLVLLAGGLIYGGIRNVINIKGGNDSGGDFIFPASTGDVLGIPGVPEFPGSIFMYEGYVDKDTVQMFLSDKKSAYTLPVGTNWEDVVEFYKRELEKRGWSHELSVDLTDESMMPGEYWVKRDVVQGDLPEVDSGEDGGVLDQQSLSGRGLRLYSRLNDAWYEEISVSQAMNGLADVVAERKDLEFLISMGSGQELPPAFPWKLQFSSEWTVEVKDSVLLDFQIVEFVSSDNFNEVSIIPVDFMSAMSLEDMGREYIEDGNVHRDSEDRFDVVDVGSKTVAEQSAMVFELKSSSTSGYLCIVANPANGVVYGIAAYRGSSPFFNYVLENIEIRGG